MINNTAMRVPLALRSKVECVTKTRSGWRIELVPGYFCLHCYGRTIDAATKREALLLLDRAVAETFYEEDAKGRRVAERIPMEEARQRYPELPEGHTLKSHLTGEWAQYVIPGLYDWGELAP